MQISLAGPFLTHTPRAAKRIFLEHTNTNGILWYQWSFLNPALALNFSLPFIEFNTFFLLRE